MMISVKDVAKHLNVSEKKVYRLIAQNSVPYYKIGEEYRFNRVELLEWANTMGIKVSMETFDDSDKNSPANISFLEALKAGDIHYNIQGTDKESVLRNVVKTINLPKKIDPEFLLQVLLAREKMGSTGIGDGIAIPHVRNPVILNRAKPVISLCFLEHPVQFNSIDGLPVKTLFTIISPTIRVHLQLLSQLSFMLQNPGFKDAIQNNAAPEIIFKTLESAEIVSTS